MKGYNFIFIMNEEIEWFTETQRNILTYFIKIIILQFDKMDNMKCENIFKNLIPEDNNYKKHVKKIFCEFTSIIITI